MRHARLLILFGALVVILVIVYYSGPAPKPAPSLEADGNLARPYPTRRCRTPRPHFYGAVEDLLTADDLPLCDTPLPVGPTSTSTPRPPTPTFTPRPPTPTHTPTVPTPTHTPTSAGPTPTPTATPIILGSGSDLQAALNMVGCGGSIRLQAGVTWTTATSFTLPAKSCSDYITVYSSGALPSSGVRLNPATHGAQLARLVATGSWPVIVSAAGANHWRFIGLDITGGSVEQRVLVEIGTNITHEQRLSVTDFIFDRCFVHSSIISWNNLTPSSDRTPQERGIQIDAYNWQVINSYVGGFAGRDLNGIGNASMPVFMDSDGGNALAENNYFEAWYSGFFLGGSDMYPVAAHTATMSNAGTIGTVTLSQHQDLAIDDLMSMQCSGCSAGWAVGKVTAINGNVISYTPQTQPLQDFAVAPNNGGQARWRGSNIDGVTVRKNTFTRPSVWCDGSEPKNYIEVKAGKNVTFEGNFFGGCIPTFPNFTVRNQYGSSPWVEVTNVIFRNNYINKLGMNGLWLQLQDNEKVTGLMHDYEFSNNLVVTDAWVDGLALWGPGDNISFSHNTLLHTKAIGYVSYWTESPPTGVTFIDNIWRYGSYGLTCDSGGTPFTDCWPTFPDNFHHNVVIDSAGVGGVGAIFPNDQVAASDAAVGWVNQLGGDYRLAASSPYKGDGTGGSDPGIDQDALEAALGFTIPVTTPTPTSIPATPTHTPTPIPPTPTFTPTVNVATPTSTPVATPALLYAPLTANDTAWCGSGVNWYGTCHALLKVFGQATGSLKEFANGEVTGHNAYQPTSVAIDTSVIPNRLYMIAGADSRVLGWSSLGTCHGLPHDPCTSNSDCVGKGGTCDINSSRDADIVIGHDEMTESACNRDGNIGIYDSPDGTKVCGMNYPATSNIAESYYAGSIDVDSYGSVYIADNYNSRVLRYDSPFTTDQVADWMFGQVPWGNQEQPPDPSTLAISSQPNCFQRSRGGVTVDSNRDVWIADFQHRRVLKVPYNGTQADFVLGQPDLNSYYDDRCYGEQDPPATQPANTLCAPILARVNETTNDLWVLDGDTCKGPQGIARFMIFHPPFDATNNYAKAAQVWKPNIPTKTIDGGGTAPYRLMANGFRFNTFLTPPYNQGVVWMTEFNEISNFAQQTILFDADGDPLKNVGTGTSPDDAKSLPSQCGSIDTERYGFTPTGSPALDRDGNIYVASQGKGTIARYELPVTNYTNGGVLCPEKPTAGMLEPIGYGHANGPASSKQTNGGLAFNGSTAVILDSPINTHGMRVKNSPLTSASGAPWDVTLPRVFSSAGGMVFDDDNHLWRRGDDNEGNNILQAFTLPITGSSTPVTATIKWLDESAVTLGSSSGYLAFNGGHLYLSDVRLSRILRISDYENIDTTGIVHVDQVIGQTGRTGTYCNRDATSVWPNSGNANPSATTLCYPSMLSFDGNGNFYVLDDPRGDTFCGNNRVLEYTAATIAAAGDTEFPNMTATGILNTDGSFTTKGNCGIQRWAALAGDPDGGLMAANGELGLYRGAPYLWRLFHFANIVSSMNPEYYMRLPLGYVCGLAFDADGNLAVHDCTWPRLLFVDPSETTWHSPVAGYTFGIDLDASSRRIRNNGSYIDISFSIINSQGTFSNLTYGVTGVPTGVTTSFTPGSCSGLPCSASLRVTATASAASKSYEIEVHVTSAEGLRKSVKIPIVIGGALACHVAPGYSSPPINSDAVFYATGGTGAKNGFLWQYNAADITTCKNPTGPRCRATFPSSGQKTVTVTLGGESQSCSVTVP